MILLLQLKDLKIRLYNYNHSNIYYLPVCLSIPVNLLQKHATHTRDNYIYTSLLQYILSCYYIATASNF
jgi:hypothetical protein